jgi:hypothetical protein
MASEILPITAQSFKSIKVTPHTALKISVCAKERERWAKMITDWLVAGWRWPCTAWWTCRSSPLTSSSVRWCSRAVIKSICHLSARVEHCVFFLRVQRDVQLERAAAAVGEPAAGDGQQRAAAHRVSPHRHENDQHRGHDAPAHGLRAHAPSPQAQQLRRSVNF